jgi:hypothetical protein
VGLAPETGITEWCVAERQNDVADCGLGQQQRPNKTKEGSGEMRWPRLKAGPLHLAAIVLAHLAYEPDRVAVALTPAKRSGLCDHQ